MCRYASTPDPGFQSIGSKYISSMRSFSSSRLAIFLEWTTRIFSHTIGVAGFGWAKTTDPTCNLLPPSGIADPPSISVKPSSRSERNSSASEVTYCQDYRSNLQSL